MKPLIDGDILLHELGWSGQFKDKDTGEEVLLDFSRVEELLNNKIEIICEDVDSSTDQAVLFFSDSEWLSKKLDRPYVKGFRYEVAKAKPYKGTRNNPKPFHFYNILEYCRAMYSCVISDKGLEADDYLCIHQMRDKDTIICSRDKDLRMCEGWHYSWECGKQKALMPMLSDKGGKLQPKNDWGEKGKTKEVLGYGDKFFWFQMLTGDSADNIPGLGGWGTVKAYNELVDADPQDCMEKVKTAYKELGMSKDYFLEQAYLLWMVRELDEDGNPVMFKL